MKAKRNLSSILVCSLILAGILSCCNTDTASAQYYALPADGAAAAESTASGTDAVKTTSSAEDAADAYEMVYATCSVNVRTGPSTDYSIVATLSKGDEVARVSSGEDGWDTVIYDDQTCYISAKYLSEYDPTESVTIDDDAYPLVYEDETASITITKEMYCGCVCYAAHLQFTDYTRFGTACANGTYGSYETTSSAAERLSAVFAVNGDYCSPDVGNPVVRNSTVYADKLCTVAAVYSNKTGIFCSPESLGITGYYMSTLVNNGTITDSFRFLYFQPGLIDGELTASSDTTSRAQRTFMGTNGEAGDIWIVVSEGRYADGISAGLTFPECMELLQSKGCTFGIHLDGGGSSTMVFQGTVLNSAAANERAVVDFVYLK